MFWFWVFPNYRAMSLKYTNNNDTIEVGQNHSEEDIRPEEVSGANTITDHHPQNIDTDKPAGAKDSNDGNFMSEDEKESYVNEVKISETQGASRDTIALIIINITLKYN